MIETIARVTLGRIFEQCNLSLHGSGICEPNNIQRIVYFFGEIINIYREAGLEAVAR